MSEKLTFKQGCVSCARIMTRLVTLLYSNVCYYCTILNDGAFRTLALYKPIVVKRVVKRVMKRIQNAFLATTWPPSVQSDRRRQSLTTLHRPPASRSAPHARMPLDQLAAQFTESTYSEQYCSLKMSRVIPSRRSRRGAISVVAQAAQVHAYYIKFYVYIQYSTMQHRRRLETHAI